MELHRLVNAYSPPPLEAIAPVPPVADARPTSVPSPPAGGAPAHVPVFITPQSLVTFPGASMGVAALQSIAPGSSEWQVAAVVVVGLLLFLLTISDAQSRPKGALGWCVALIVGIINTAMLGAAAHGLAGARAAVSA